VTDHVMVVYFEEDEWKIDLATLPFLKSDCSPTAEEFNQSIRPKLSGCGHAPTVVGTTRSPPRVFFELWTGVYAQNVPHVLFEAEIARHAVRRLLSAESGIGDVL